MYNKIIKHVNDVLFSDDAGTVFGKKGNLSALKESNLRPYDY